VSEIVIYDPTYRPGPAPGPSPRPSVPAAGRPARWLVGWLVALTLLSGWDAAHHVPHIRPTPAPRPDPPPPGPPTPDPIAGKIWVAYIVDGPNATPSEAALRTSKTLRDGLEALGARLYTYDSRATAELAEHNLDEAVKGVGLPCAVIVSESGKALASIKSPDEALILNTVKQYRGK
jgi:hypothetical protein